MKSIKDIRESLSGEIKELKSNQIKIKKTTNEIQLKMEALPARISRAEERIRDVEDQMMENKEAEKKRNKYWITGGEFER